MNNESFELLKSWCDRLLELQVTSHPEPELYGGILCPACQRIHGRTDSLIYPLVAMTDYSGDRRYLEAAKQIHHFCEYNFLRSDGSYYRDAISNWNGVTVFSTQTLAQALYYHGAVIDLETRKQWLAVIDRQNRFMVDFVKNKQPVTNYWAALAAALALTGAVRDDQGLIRAAKSYADVVMEHLSEDGLFYGEGIFTHEQSTKGCRPIDIAYNVEETLPSLITYAELAGDEAFLLQLKAIMRVHLEFMLPDGAWDSSFSYRSAKWAYWGSRTSDGCQGALAPFLKNDPIFAAAAYLNVERYRSCTHDGLLYGGPMYHEAEQSACVHHTICHAKAVTHLMDHLRDTEVGQFERLGGQLPRAVSSGTRYFPSLDVYLLSHGGFRATVSGYDYPKKDPNLYCSGGALTMLWHEATGPLAAASMPEYTVMEVGNMQYPRFQDSACQTARIEYRSGERVYTNLYDTECMLESSAEPLTVSASGYLRSADGLEGPAYGLRYCILNNKFRIEVRAEAPDAVFVLPIVAGKEDAVTETEGGYQIKRSSLRIAVRAGQSPKLRLQADERNFNPVGGFLTIPLEIGLRSREMVTVEVVIT